MKLQFGVEYLIVMGVLLAVLTPIVIYTSNVLREQGQSQQATTAASVISEAIESVASQGYPARKTVIAVFPENLAAGSYVANRTVVVKARPGPEVADYVIAHNRCAYGKMPARSGYYRITVYALPDGCVKVSTGDILVVPDILSLFVASSTNANALFTLSNLGDPANTTMTVNGIVSNYIDMDISQPGMQNSVQFLLNGTKNFQIGISSPGGVGIYTGNITLQSQAYNTSIPATLSVPGTGPNNLTVLIYSDSSRTKPASQFSVDSIVYIKVSCDTSSGLFNVINIGPDEAVTIGTGACPQALFNYNTAGNSVGQWRVKAIGGRAEGEIGYLLLGGSS